MLKVNGSFIQQVLYPKQYEEKKTAQLTAYFKGASPFWLAFFCFLTFLPSADGWRFLHTEKGFKVRVAAS
jgi:hypothetical protein